jgi:hypothetical protein
MCTCNCILLLFFFNRMIVLIKKFMYCNWFRDLQAPTPSYPSNSSSSTSAQQHSANTQPLSHGNPHTVPRTLGVRPDRFTPSPKKDQAQQPEAVKYGRNDWVTISNGSETQHVKWKKAEALVNTGRWKVVSSG